MANSLNWRNQVVFSSGDTIKVHQTITEGKKTRTQIFEGLVIRIRGHQNLKSFTVRKIGVNNIGVEKIFPENTPTVTKIEVKKKGKVRRAVLSYLKKRVGKKATKVKDVFVKAEAKPTPAPTAKTATTTTAATTSPDQPSKLQPTTKREKSEKAKKIKKGPKKIVRKERHFQR